MPKDLPDLLEHADMTRRMTLLQMTGGDLKRAMELEQWVKTGASVTIKVSAPPVAGVVVTGVCTGEPLHNAGDDNLALPAHLDRRAS